MKRADLHPTAFGVTVVIVGLSVREAILRVVPAATSLDAEKGAIPEWQFTLEALRTALFLTVLIRFYLGSVAYFDEVYLNAETSPQYSGKLYWLDYFLGVIHFIFFFAWATTVDNNERHHAAGASHFLGFGCATLLYDLVWLFVSVKLSTFDKIKFWAALNLFTVVMSGFIFYVAKELTTLDAVMREQLAMLPVALVSILDLAEIFNQQPYIENAIKGLFSTRKLSNEKKDSATDRPRSRSAKP